MREEAKLVGENLWDDQAKKKEGRKEKMATKKMMAMNAFVCEKQLRRS